MTVKAVFFDLDGTLLPMDQDRFVASYLEKMARKMASWGYDPKRLVEGMWAGTGAMVKNDGSRSNEEVFWQTFNSCMGFDARRDDRIFLDFYENEFQSVRLECGFSPDAARIQAMLEERGIPMVLATNPLFPAAATFSRARWAGLDPQRLAYITTYENSRFCKPNPDYYRELLDKLKLDPRECIMVGNDVREDTVPALLGMEVFLLTPCLINRTGEDISRYPHGDFPRLMAYLQTMTAK